MRAYDTIARLIEKSWVVSTAATLALISCASYLWITNRPVPSDLLSLLYIMLGVSIGIKGRISDKGDTNK